MALAVARVAKDPTERVVEGIEANNDSVSLIGAFFLS